MDNVTALTTGILVTAVISILMFAVYWTGFEDGKEQSFYAGGYDCALKVK